MKKIALIVFLIILTLCSCKKEHTYEAVIGVEPNKLVIKKNKIINSKSEEPDIIKEKNVSKNENSSPKTIIDIIKPSEEEPENIDKEDINYFIHQGKIDCQSKEDCLIISKKIIDKYHLIISDASFIPVKSNKQNILGYFIKYNFKNIELTDYNECLSLGEELQNELIDHIKNYECNELNYLIITTNY